MASSFHITLDTTPPTATTATTFDAAEELLDGVVTLSEPGSVSSAIFQDGTNGAQVGLQVEGMHVFGHMAGGAWVPGWLHLTVVDDVGNQGVVSQYIEGGTAARIRRFVGRLRVRGGNKKREMTDVPPIDRNFPAPPS
jgi:hypothetical protein